MTLISICLALSVPQFQRHRTIKYFIGKRDVWVEGHTVACEFRIREHTNNLIYKLIDLLLTSHCIHTYTHLPLERGNKFLLLLLFTSSIVSSTQIFIQCSMHMLCWQLNSIRIPFSNHNQTDAYWHITGKNRSNASNLWKSCLILLRSNNLSDDLNVQNIKVEIGTD